MEICLEVFVVDNQNTRVLYVCMRADGREEELCVSKVIDWVSKHDLRIVAFYLGCLPT